MKAKAFLKPAVLAVSCVFVVCFAYFCLYVPYRQLSAFRHVKMCEVEGSYVPVSIETYPVVLEGKWRIYNPSSVTVKVDGATFTIYGVLDGKRLYGGEGKIMEEVTLLPGEVKVVTVRLEIYDYDALDCPTLEFVGKAYRYTMLGKLSIRFDITMTFEEFGTGYLSNAALQRSLEVDARAQIIFGLAENVSAGWSGWRGGTS